MATAEEIQGMSIEGLTDFLMENDYTDEELEDYTEEDLRELALEFASDESDDDMPEDDEIDPGDSESDSASSDDSESDDDSPPAHGGIGATGGPRQVEPWPSPLDLGTHPRSA